ncbi:MAG: ABC transporter substrate-binding protein [Actinomycetota bacterium]
MRSLTAVLLLVLLVAGPARAQQAPEAVVEGFCNTLLAAMKGGSAMGFAGRQQLLAPVIQRDFAIPEMTRLAIGPFAARLPADQVARIADAFARWTVATYASQFNTWGGESFEVGTPHPSTGDAVQVPTRIIFPTGEPTRLDYVLRPLGGRWQVVDILAEGTISQLAVRRSEFVGALRSGGPDGLVNALGRKTRDLASR